MRERRKEKRVVSIFSCKFVRRKRQQSITHTQHNNPPIFAKSSSLSVPPGFWANARVRWREETKLENESYGFGIKIRRPISKGPETPQRPRLEKSCLQKSGPSSQKRDPLFSTTTTLTHTQNCEREKSFVCNTYDGRYDK